MKGRRNANWFRQKYLFVLNASVGVFTATDSVVEDSPLVINQGQTRLVRVLWAANVKVQLGNNAEDIMLSVGCGLSSVEGITHQTDINSIESDDADDPWLFRETWPCIPPETGATAEPIPPVNLFYSKSGDWQFRGGVGSEIRKNGVIFINVAMDNDGFNPVDATRVFFNISLLTLYIST